MRLPPLNALRAFEAAARHLSVQQAAKELFVTAAAVSQQIKLLEDRLGYPLFRRLPRRLELTEAGAAFLPRLTVAFRALQDACDEMEARQEDKRGRLLIAAPPTFALNWLLPRLQEFQAQLPEVEIELATRTSMADAVRGAAEPSEDLLGGADVAIRFGDGDYPGYAVTRLFSLHSTPMCSPALIDGRHPLREPEDLRHHKLLHVRNDVAQMDVGWPGWKDWFAAAGVASVAYKRGPVFNQVSLAIEAAADRMGVVLGVPLLATRELSAGRLTIPFPISLTMSMGYSIVHATATHADVKAFRRWLVAQAEAEKWARPLGGLEPLRWTP